MKHSVFRVIIEPLLLRVGSIASGVLVGYGMAEGNAIHVQTGILAAGLVAVDLVTRRLWKS